MNNDFLGKSAVITGAASGIGAAVARELAAGGANLVIADLDGAAADRLCQELPSARPFQLNVADPATVEAMVAFAVDTYGGLHLAVNSAGVGGPVDPTADYPIEEWRHVIDVDLNGVFYAMKYEIAAMQAGGGAIVNISSIFGSQGCANAIAYVAAKHALVGMTKTAALEYSARGVRVNAIGPGVIETPLLGDLAPDAKRALVSLHPIGRLGAAHEVAALACFLLSPRASFITGSYHLVDGGFSAR